MERTKMSQADVKSPDVVHLKDNRTAEMLVPSLDREQELVIVPKQIAQHLVTLMPKATIEQVIGRFSEKAGECTNSKEWIALLRDELNFHAGMEMLEEYFAPTDAKELIADATGR